MTKTNSNKKFLFATAAALLALASTTSCEHWSSSSKNSCSGSKHKSGDTSECGCDHKCGKPHHAKAKKKKAKACPTTTTSSSSHAATDSSSHAQ